MVVRHGSLGGRLCRGKVVVVVVVVVAVVVMVVVAVVMYPGL